MGIEDIVDLAPAGLGERQNRGGFRGIDDGGLLARGLMQQIAVIVAEQRNELYFHGRGA